jgi:hypothetical protein
MHYFADVRARRPAAWTTTLAGLRRDDRCCTSNPFTQPGESLPNLNPPLRVIGMVPSHGRDQAVALARLSHRRAGNRWSGGESDQCRAEKIAAVVLLAGGAVQRGVLTAADRAGGRWTAVTWCDISRSRRVRS